MKIPRIDYTYLLYVGAIASVLTCMMLLTCESCNDYYDSGNVVRRRVTTANGDTVTIVVDTLCGDTIMELPDSSLTDSVATEEPSDTVSADTVVDEKAEERRFIKEHFVEVKSMIPDLIEEIRYNSTHNFVGRRINGYEESVALLTKEAALALKEVADELRPKGYRIKIYDSYRPQDAVEHFRSWVVNPSDTLTKSEFYPDKEKSVLFQEGYISSRSRHCHGSTIDMTLCTMSGQELDMGGTFDLFSERSHSDHTETLTSSQLSNRSLLRSTMEKHGFVIATTEWWHFRLGKEPFPDKAFNFHVASLSKLTTDPNAKPAPAKAKKTPPKRQGRR